MKWGILATGTIAKKFAATVNQMKDAKEVLVAVGSRREESARQFAEEYQIQKYYGSYEELAEDPEVEVVYVATPNKFHYENCEMCLNAGKHVLCEKPFTTNADEARELYRLAEEKGFSLWKHSDPVPSGVQPSSESSGRRCYRTNPSYPLRVRIYRKGSQKRPEI